VIALRSVGKTYRSLFRRPVRALDDVSLDIAAGEVVGIAGPNGAGKSTLINLRLGFLAPTDGTVTVAGQAPRAYVEAHGIGYLPELMALPQRWRVRAALHRLGTLAGVPAPDLAAAVDRVIDTLGIAEHADKPLRALSKGNFQRLGIAQVLLRDDDLLVFDEPTHGLDPTWTARFREIIVALRRPGRAMLLASHNLDELERLCDRVVIFDRGRVQRVVAVADERAHATAYRLRLAAGRDVVERHFPGAVAESPMVLAVDVPDVTVLNDRLALAIAEGARFTEVAPRDSALEAAFRQAVRS